MGGRGGAVTPNMKNGRANVCMKYIVNNFIKNGDVKDLMRSKNTSGYFSFYVDNI